LETINDIETRYVNKTSEIYKSNYSPLEKPLEKLDSIVITKFKKLKNSETISELQYNNAIKNYNNFILNLTLLKQFKHRAS